MISTVRLFLFLIVLTNHITTLQSNPDQTQGGASKPSTSHSPSLSHSTSRSRSSSGPEEHSTPPSSNGEVFKDPYNPGQDKDYVPGPTGSNHLLIDFGNGCQKSQAGKQAAKCTCMGKEISCDELDKTGNIGLIALTTTNVFLSICCIVISGFMIYFRIKTGSTKSLVNILYLRNGLADFFVGIGVLSQSPVLYLMISKGRDISGITVPVFISYFVTAVAVKMSVFLNCVLGVVRCINIVKPFYKPNKKVLNASTLVYMIIWGFMVGLDIWQFTEKINQENKALLVKSFLLKGQSGFGLVLVTKNEDQVRSSYLAFHLGNLIQFIIPTALPSLLCFVLMIVQLYHMPKKTKKSKNGKDRVSKASLTIFHLTCIYVITSGVSVVTWLVVHGRRGYLGSKKEYEAVMEEKRTATSWSDLTAIYFSLSTCPLICSTLTPLTLLLRGTGPAFSSVRKIFTKSSSKTTDTTF